MTQKQKIKNLVIILIIMSVMSLASVFYSQLNPVIINALKNNFNIVSAKGNLMVHFINVGQGDAVAINLPDNKVMLIDDGSKNYNVDYVNYIKENVCSRKTNNCIDYLVLTHADSDHIGGTLKLMKNFKINTVFMPKIISNSQTFEKIQTYVTKNCNYEELGDEFVIANNDYEIVFFKQLNDDNTNDSSQVVKLSYLDKSFLFTGDISSSVEDSYIKSYSSALDCDVLKVSHHGSASSTSNEFLQAVTPKYAVISVGSNSYGHPTYDVLSRLESNNSKILRTDKHDNILFVVGQDYGLIELHTNYHITRLSLNYRNFILIIDVILFGTCVVIICKKKKRKRH